MMAIKVNIHAQMMAHLHGEENFAQPHSSPISLSDVRMVPLCFKCWTTEESSPLHFIVLIIVQTLSNGCAHGNARNESSPALPLCYFDCWFWFLNSSPAAVIQQWRRRPPVNHFCLGLALDHPVGDFGYHSIALGGWWGKNHLSQPSSFWVAQPLLSFYLLNEFFSSPDKTLLENSHMLTQKIGTFCLVFTTGVAVILLVTLKINEFVFTYMRNF